MNTQTNSTSQSNQLSHFPSTVAFIGAGNMAGAMIGGLLARGLPKEQLIATARTPERCEALSKEFGIEATSDNKAAVEQSDIVLLAVKPNAMKEVCLEIAPHLKADAVIITVAVGIPISTYIGWLGEHAIIRCMPNTPSLVQLGAIGLYANELCSETQKSSAQSVLSAIGLCVWVDTEEQIHAVTAVSGSGPAYFFLILEAMIEEGVRQGLNVEVAKQLAIQTALGAATLAAQSPDQPAELRRKVTSPNGTTEQAIKQFESENLRAIFSRAMTACSNRSKAMGEELKEQ
ncbi:pyrroline-5-carboxylate reductase [Sessilibacter sp. MAH2]